MPRTGSPAAPMAVSISHDAVHGELVADRFTRTAPLG
jgi:hypothetical protein